MSFMTIHNKQINPSKFHSELHISEPDEPDNCQTN